MNINVYKQGKSSWVGLAIPVGSRQEDNITKGKAHFLEHMLFKGTKNRTKDELKREFEKYGADLNAFTSSEKTCYWSHINSNYAYKAKEILNDMVFNSLIPEDEFNKEKDVILQEVKMYHDNPQAHVWTLANEKLFKESDGMHTSIAGTLESVKNITRKDLLDFYKGYYNKETVRTINVGNNTFDNSNQKIYPRHKYSPLIAANKQEFFETRKGISQANIVMCGTYESPHSATETYYAFQLLQAIFNGFTGRLFDTIREKNGLVYSVYFNFVQLSCNTIIWSVYAGLEKSKIPLAKELIIKELTRELSQDTINFATEKRKGELGLSLDSVKSLGRRIVHATIVNIPYKELTNNPNTNLDKVKQIISQIQHEINFNNNILVGIVPKNDLKRRFYNGRC